MRTAWAAIAAALLLQTGLLSGAAAQESKGARLTLSPNSGLPDSEVSIPAYLWNGGIPLGSISIGITFPARALTFVRAELTVVSETVGAELKVEPMVPAEAETSGIRVSVTIPEARSPREDLPDGPLLYVTFQISREATLGSEIILKPAAVGLTVDTPRGPSGPIEAGDARITVQSPPVSGCFFYMH